MNKKTTTEAAQALGLTRKTLCTILAYHSELRPSEAASLLTLPHFMLALWSDTEIERVRAHCTRPPQRARTA